MSDKAKYASHGTFITRLQQGCLTKWNKQKNGIIHPLPSTKPREVTKESDCDIKVQSSTIPKQFKFQSVQFTKVIPEQLVDPFVYIEKVIKKRKVDDIKYDQKQIRFIVPKIVKKSNFPVKAIPKVAEGYQNLFQFEEDKRQTAIKVFEKMMDQDIGDMKEMFKVWSSSKKKNADLLIKQAQFVDLMNQLVPGKLSNQLIKKFFKLYQNPPPKGKEAQPQHQLISIKAMSFNYEKFKKSHQITNILSEKAMKERYVRIKIYNEDFNEKYHSIKHQMKQIQGYEQNLRRYYKKVYEGYRNPYEDEILKLKVQLQKPIIKYDKKKKDSLNKKVEELEEANSNLFTRVTDDYQYFLSNYERAIVTNHDLFFTKRTVNKLLLPLIANNPCINRNMLEERIQQQQNAKQRYLQCISDLVIEIDSDKRNLGEDCFTLSEVINTIMMRGRGKKTSKQMLSASQPQSYVIQCCKKLVKEIKRQYLLKNQFMVEDLDNFPADQEIPMEILHKCFEIQCTKVLFKNQIWNELINLIPVENVKSHYHQSIIDANVCMEFINRYFQRLDFRISIQLTKSKQASLLGEKLTIQNFGNYAVVLDEVIHQARDYVVEPDEDPLPVDTNKKKVGFADVIEQQIQKNDFPEDYVKQISKKQTNKMVKSILKAIHEPQLQPKIKQQQNHEWNSDIPDNINLLKTLARSEFIPNNAINTNSFDIRFYEKMDQANLPHPNQEEISQSVVRNGTSVLLSNLPQVDQLPIPAEDPLRISRYLLSNLDNSYQEKKKIVQSKVIDHDIEQGISHNYYREKIKLQNKPTVWDCQGKTKYSVLFPVGYYQGFMAEAPQKEKWYLRAHHVETLTENPLSKKDNLIKTEYESKLQRIVPKKMAHQFAIEENVKGKEHAIGSLEERLSILKKELEVAQRKKVQGATVPNTQLDKYLIEITEGKEGKQLQIGAYEAILYDLRKKQRNILNGFRDDKNDRDGDPTEKWWQRKDKKFNQELRKERLLVADSFTPEHKHRVYVDKLKNNELY